MQTNQKMWTVSAVQNVLVPTDLHEHSEHSLRYAEAFARESGATLHILHVITTAFRKQKFGEEIERRPGYTVEDEVEEALEELVARVRADGVTAKRHMRSGHTEKETLRLVDELSADLVVMCAGERLSTDEWYASKYVKVLHDADVPVLGVKNCEHEFIDEAARRLSLKRVMVPCDLSEFSQQAVPVAAEMCRHFGAELVLGHVAHTFEEYAALDGSGGRPDNPIDTQEVFEKLLAQYPDVRSKMIAIKAQLQSGLVKICNDENIDLLVMATHARKPLMPTVIASFTQKLIAAVPCPVMTIRPERFAERYGAIR